MVQGPMPPWKRALRGQFGAAVETLQRAIEACPETLWGQRDAKPEYWRVAYHTLFFLDLYMRDSPEGFAPPPPFTLDEGDPDAPDPPQPYSKRDLQQYLRRLRVQARESIDSLSDDRAAERCGFHWVEGSVLELYLYNLRHVQHHAAQLNLLLRQNVGSAPKWVRRADDSDAT
jgi:hypothetical protein